MFRVELSKQVRRWRTWLLAAALAGVPVLVVIAVRLSPPPPQNSQDAPPFLLQIVRNGLFAPLTGLALVQPFIVLRARTKKILAALFIVGATLLPIGIFLIHYVALTYSPFAVIGWASILAAVPKCDRR